jgi:hypothetical protein
MSSDASADLVDLFDRVDQLEAELVKARSSQAEPQQDSLAGEFVDLKNRVQALSVLSTVALAAVTFLLVAMKPHLPDAGQWSSLDPELKALWWLAVTIFGGLSVWFTFGPGASSQGSGVHLVDFVPLGLASIFSIGAIILYPRLVGEIAETKLHFACLWLACLNSGAILSREVSRARRDELPLPIQTLNTLSLVLLGLCVVLGWGFVVVRGWALGTVEPIVTVLLLVVPSVAKHLHLNRS